MTIAEKITNLEFAICFSETNLRWLAGTDQQDLIAKNKQAIAENSALVEILKKTVDKSAQFVEILRP